DDGLGSKGHGPGESYDMAGWRRGWRAAVWGPEASNGRAAALKTPSRPGQRRQDELVRDVGCGMSICDVERLVTEACHPVDVEDPRPQACRQVGGGLEGLSGHAGAIVEVEAALALVGLVVGREEDHRAGEQRVLEDRARV